MCSTVLQCILFRSTSRRRKCCKADGSVAILISGTPVNSVVILEFCCINISKGEGRDMRQADGLVPRSSPSAALQCLLWSSHFQSLCQEGPQVCLGIWGKVIS